ncbi:MAG: NADP-dependent malic enzyme [Acetobacteraceae bacterium]
MNREDFRKAALDYHRLPRPGKLAVEPTKRLASNHDLALAYSPGVAAACEAIAADPAAAADYTARANLVAVISNGTAVLGLGAIGPLAAKPVMEGKAVLFKKFAGIDVFDLEVDATDPQRFCDVVAALEPTFGGINLEDIKAPDCFVIEAELRRRMTIPVFHDDQHGTAIIVAAAVRNGLALQGKRLEEARLVTSGAGAAALACLDLLAAMGLKPENVTVTDIAGVVFEGRTELMDPWKERWARPTEARTLAEALAGADIFLGLSAPNVVQPAWLGAMAERPLILALANPVPEIAPEAAKAARPDAIICTGRSDYPNQVNNVLCFPFIFRGALDVGATTINDAMKIAAADAIAALAREEPSEVVQAAYGGAATRYGPDTIIPKPFDPRLILRIAPAVARAAMASGVATRPIADFAAYEARLAGFAYRSGQLMRPVFAAAAARPMRVVYAEGEDDRVLRAAQIALDEGIARPVLVGRREVVVARIAALGLRLREGADVEIRDPTADDAVFGPLVEPYHRLVERRGIPPDTAARQLRTRPTVAACMLLMSGAAEAALCGTIGPWMRQWERVRDIVGRRPGVARVSALSGLILPGGPIFVVDTHVNPDPTAEEIAEATGLAAEAVRRFGVEPKVALLSHSNFGSSGAASARKMRAALALITARFPRLEVEGEMHADAALSEQVRSRIFPRSRLAGVANLLVMPNLDAANIAFELLKIGADGLPVGPILLGMARPVHILNPTVTARGVLNVTALAVREAQELAEAAGGAGAS